MTLRGQDGRQEVQGRSRVARSQVIALAPLLITAFLDMVGLLMVVPLLPYYARTFGAGGFFVAALVSVFTLAQLLSAPLWGRVSDRYGRRPILLLGLAATMCASLVFAMATSLWLLLLSRVVQGVGGGTTGVIQAYIADTVDARARAKVLGWVSSATSLGMVLGPPFGAFALRGLGPSGPGIVAALLCALNIGFAARYVRETRDALDTTNDVDVRTPQAARFSFGWRVSSERVSRIAMTTVRTLRRRARQQPAIPLLIGMYAIALGAYQGSLALLMLFLADTFRIQVTASWIVFTYIGALAVVLRAGPVGWAVDHYGEVPVARWGLVLLALGLVLLPFMPTLSTLAGALALIPVGAAFTFPCLTALLLHLLAPAERGMYMGMQQTAGGVTRVVIPLWAGFAYDHLGHSVPFWTVAALVGGVGVLGMRSMPAYQL